MNNFSTKLVISTGALAVAIVRVIFPNLHIDAIALALLLVAVLPWFSALLESAKLPGGWEIKFRVMQAKQDQQQSEIDALRFLIHHFLSADELRHLRAFASGASFAFTKSGTTGFFIGELRRLVSLGLIERLQSKGFRSLLSEGGDVKTHFSITEQGKQYLAVLQAETPESLA